MHCLGLLLGASLGSRPISFAPLFPYQGEATAALAALAMANGRRPPEHPLADPTALLGNTQVGS